ncbi:hypothetical protein [Phytohabitans rumicis]|uniref:Uncharacterized protein n=1 Tax=Phytohabitans rumicis TaxID=1076125 RepID=A0A6V8KWU8_9ACTN|nr:hypothetical protein [Phytohabitans rumicis]GFJ87860.1 hypothetical protein Prum_015020 [Phytohabitans rumicis]
MALWASGTLLAASGVVGDRREWWTEQPFLTNLVSSITGACFGIPIALLVLQALSAAHAERLEMRSTARLALRTVKNMCRSSRRLLPNGESEGAGHIKTALSELRSISIIEPLRYKGIADIRTLEQAMMRIVTCFPEKGDLTVSVHELQRTWDFLVSDIRYRLAELDLPWLPAKTVADMDALLNTITIGDFAWLVELQGEGNISSYFKGVKESRVLEIDPHAWEVLREIEGHFEQVGRCCGAAEMHVANVQMLVKMCDAIEDAIGEALAGYLSAHSGI